MPKPPKPLPFPSLKEYYNDKSDIQKSIESLHAKIESNSKSDLKWIVCAMGIISSVGLSVMGAMFLFLWKNFDQSLKGIEAKIDKTEQITEARMEQRFQQSNNHTTQQIMNLTKIVKTLQQNSQ